MYMCRKKLLTSLRLNILLRFGVELDRFSDSGFDMAVFFRCILAYIACHRLLLPPEVVLASLVCENVRARFEWPTARTNQIQQTTHFDEILTHWSLHKITKILQDIFSHTFSWMIMNLYRFLFYIRLYSSIDLCSGLIPSGVGATNAILG